MYAFLNICLPYKSHATHENKMLVAMPGAHKTHCDSQPYEWVVFPDLDEVLPVGMLWEKGVRDHDC